MIIKSIPDVNREYVSLNESLDSELLQDSLMIEAAIIRESFSTDVYDRSIVEEGIVQKAKNLANKVNAKKQTIGERISAAFTKVINFIRSVAKKFMAKCKELIINNEKWFKENIYKFENITDEYWNNVKITCFPYITGAPNGNRAETFNISIFASGLNVSKIAELKNRLKEKISDQDLRQAVCKTLYNINPDNFIDAAKTFYRGGRQEIKEFKGTDAATACGDFKDFIRNYQATSRNVGNELVKMANEMERIKNEISKSKEQQQNQQNQQQNIVTTSTSTTTGDNKQAETNSLNELDNLFSDILMEDGTPEKGKTTGGNGQVEVTGNSSGNGNSTKTSNPDEIYNQNALNYYKLLVNILTAKMTITEECYNAALRTVRSVITSFETK